MKLMLTKCSIDSSKKYMRYFFCIIVMAIAGIQGINAQNFPVTSVVQVMQFSPFIESYDDPGKVIITLVSTDERPEYEALLRITLSGPGFSIRTNPNFMPFPVVLRRNIPLVLTGAQLREYFDPANLLFGGQSMEAFQANGGIFPEGPVSLCVEVFDYNRFFDPPVSNNGCATGLMLLHRPPVLLEPIGETPVNTPQQIRFQWQPQHAGFVAKYTLEVYENTMPGMGNNLVIETTQPILQINTPVSFYLMTNFDPLLEPNTQYLVRVKAEDITGQAAFLNNGWSDIYSFTLMSDENGDGICGAPTGFQYVVIGQDSVQLLWEPQNLVQSWTLNGEGINSPNLPAESQSYIASGLRYGQEYSYILCAVCPNGGQYCDTLIITIPNPEDPKSCGPELLVQSTPLSNQNLEVSWNHIPQATGYTLSWTAVNTSSSGRRRTGNEEPAQQSSVQIAAGQTAYTIPGLQKGKTYQFQLCKICPSGEVICHTWTAVFEGLQNDCVVDIQFTRTDSTSTSFTLSWTYDPNHVSIDGNFSLIWQIADGTLPPDTAQLAYTSETYTIEDLLPGRAYYLKVCAQCTPTQFHCIDLPPIGGCPSAYTPLLIDLAGAAALIAWPLPIEEESPKPVRARFRPLVNPGWQNTPVGQNDIFDQSLYGLTASQIAELKALDPKWTYAVQIQTLCNEDLWSDWSAPVLFCLECSVTDPLILADVTHESASILGLAKSNAEYYEFEYRVQGQNEWIKISGLTQPLLALTDLLPATGYEARMRYFCTRGVWSDYSPVLAFTTLPVCGTPTLESVEPILANAAQINWTMGENAEKTTLRYRLKSMSFWGNMNLPWQTIQTTNDFAMLSDLIGGGTYLFQMQSDCGVNQSEWTETDEFELLCSAPGLVQASEITFESALISLSQTPQAAQSYQIYYKLTDDENWTQVNTFLPQAVLQELDDWAYYDVKVTTTCTSGQISDFSEIIQFHTPAKCLVPDNLIASNIQPFSARIDWAITGTMLEWEILLKDDNPVNPGIPNQQSQQQGASGQRTGGQRGGSQISSAPDPYAGWLRFSVNEPFKVFTNLRPENPYRVVVRAKCAGGAWTAYSDELKFSTLADCKAPVSLSVDQILQKSARTKWARANVFDDEYKVLLESVHPIPTGNTSTSSQSSNNSQSRPGSGPRQSPLPQTAIYRDSTQTTQRQAIFDDLRPNTEYRFRVKTRCDNFGWTEYGDWFSFTTDECAAPTDIAEEAIDRSTMRLSWTPSSGTNNYEVKYKLDDPGAPDWLTVNTTESFAVLNPLLSNKVYLYQISEVCQGGAGVVSAPQDSFYMKKPSINTGLYVCGMQPNVDLSNQTPLSLLEAGDSIVIFDFIVVVTAASGGSGYFSGAGEIRMPYFNKAKFKFIFDNVFINDEYRVVGGYMEATGFGIEVLPPWADSLLSDITELLETVDEILEEEQIEALQELILLGQNAGISPELQQQIQEVINCFQQATTSEEIAACTQMMNEVIAAVEEFLEALYDGDFQVVFSPTADQNYGFDGKSASAPEDWYEKRTIAGAEYYIAYKSAKRGHGEETLIGTVAEPGELSEVTFTQISNNPLPFTAQGRQATVTFIGQEPETYYLAANQITPEEEDPDFIAGLLKVVTYNEKPLNVVLVPLSASAAAGVDAAQIQEDLQEIYRQAVVNPTVTLAPVFTPEDFTPPLLNVASGLLSNFTSQMRAIQSDFESAGLSQSNTYYLFLTDDYEATNRAGFMPRGRKYGYIYMGNAGSGQALSRVIAHELGHGAFVLEHTYEAYESELPEGQTDNLMDKGSGTRLYKWQWDLIHNPVSPPWLEGDEEGESVIVTNMRIFDKFRNDVDSTLTFLTPAGRVITLPKNTTSVTFNSGDNIQKAEGTCVTGFKIFAFGTLRSFIANGSEFVTCYTCNTQAFAGYTVFDPDPGCGVFYLDTLSKSVKQNGNPGISKAIVGFPCFQDNQIVFKIGQMGASANAAEIQSETYRGSGANKNFDWLAGAFNSISTNTVIQSPSFSPALDVKITSFLQKVAGYGGCGSPSALYVFAHIHQLNINLDFYKACGLDLLAETQTDAEDIFNRLNRNYRQAMMADEFGVNAINLPIPTFESAEILAWKNSDLSIYQAVGQLRQSMWSDQYWAGLDENSATDARKVLDAFYEYREDECVFRNLKIDQRIKALKLLNKLALTESNFFDAHFSPLCGFGVVIPYSEDDEEHLYNAILGTTPNDVAQYEAILNFYKGESGDYAEFFSVANKMLDFMGDEGYARFAETLTRMVLAVKGQPNLTITPQDPSAFNNTYFPTNIFCDIEGQQTPAELVYVKSFYAGTDYYFGSDYEASFANNKINISATFSYYQFNSEYSGETVTLQDYTITGNPFDYVAIKIDDALKIIGGGATVFEAQSGILIVPYCWAHIVYDRLDDAEVQLGIRMAGNALSLALVPFSGGASLALRTLIYAEAAYSLADGYVASDAYEWAHTGSGNLSQSFHNIWNTTGLVIGAANVAGAITIPAYASRVTKVNLSKLKQTYDQIKQSPLYSEAAFNELRLKFGQTYDEFVNFRNGLNPNNLPPGWVLTQADLDFLDRFIANFAREMDFIEFYAKYAPKPWASGGNQLLATIDLADEVATGGYQLILKEVGQGGFALPMGGVAKTNGRPLSPSNWLPPGGGSSSTVQVGFLDNVLFVNAQGAQITGKLAIYLDPTNPTQVFFKVINTLTAEGIWNVTQKIAQGKLGAAFDMVVSLSGNPVFTTLQSQYNTLLQQWISGTIGYTNYTTSLNQIRQQLIDALITAVPSGQSGINQTVVNGVVNKIINANTGSAINDVFAAANDLDKYKSALALKGRHSTLISLDAQGIINYSQSSTTLNQINDATLALLPSSSAGAGGLTNIELQVLVGQVHIGVLDKAFGNAAEFITTPVFAGINSQAVANMTNYIAGSLSSLDLVLGRNQIIKQFIDNIPLSPTGTGGWTNPAITAIKGQLANGDLGQAITSALAVIDDLDTYKTFLQLEARHKGLAHDQIKGIISGSDYQVVRSQIEEAVLLRLPSIAGGIPPPVTMAKVVDNIKLGNLDVAIDGAIALGGNAALATQYANLIEAKIQGVISYPQFVATRSQLWDNLVSGLAASPTGSGGLTPQIVLDIKQLIANADPDAALLMAFNANTNTAIYKQLLAVSGRLRNIKRDQMLGIGSHSDISDELASVNAAFLNALPSGFNWSILNWTPNTVHIDIRDFLDGLIAQSKVGIGAWNGAGSYYPVNFIEYPGASPIEIGKLSNVSGNGQFELVQQSSNNEQLLFSTANGKIVITEQIGGNITKLKACDYAAPDCNMVLKVQFGFANTQITKVSEVIPSARLDDFISDLKTTNGLPTFFQGAGSQEILGHRLGAWDGLYSTGFRTDISWLTRASQWLGEGGEFVTDAGVTWFRKNGENVFEVKNGGILPNQQVHYDQVGAGTPVGDVINGYQVVKVGNDIKVRRVPDETPYTGTPYLGRLTEHPDAHVLERHGHDVTDDALAKRATTGIAPDGSTTNGGNPPPYSSKFASSDKIKEVLDNVGPGSPNWNPPSSGNYAFDYPVTGSASTPFGYGIPSGGGSALPMNRVKVVYKKDGGVWKLLTMYPQP